MALSIVIPTPLRKFTCGAEIVDVEGATVAEALEALDRKFPGLQAQVCDPTGGLKRFMNIYVNGEDVRFLDNLSTKVADGSEIAIVPAIAGG